MLTISETDHALDIPGESIKIHDSRNTLPEGTFSVNTLKKYISNQVTATIDQLPDFRAISEQVVLSLDDMKNMAHTVKEVAIYQTSSAIEGIANTVGDASNTLSKLGDFMGKIPKSMYENMQLAISNFQKNSELQTKIADISKSLSVDPYIICGICTQETKFDPTLVSPKGARGLMQLMPNTERGIRNFIEHGNTKNAGKEEKFYAELRNNSEFMQKYRSKDPNVQNLAIGCAFVSYLSEKFDGNMEAILGYYNGGGSASAKNSKENKSYAPGALGYAKIFQQMNIFGTV